MKATVTITVAFDLEIEGGKTKDEVEQLVLDTFGDELVTAEGGRRLRLGEMWVEYSPSLGDADG